MANDADRDVEGDERRRSLSLLSCALAAPPMKTPITERSLPSPRSAGAEPARAAGTKFRVLSALSFSHFLNDMTQSTILAIYPLLKGNFGLSFA